MTGNSGRILPQFGNGAQTIHPRYHQIKNHDIKIVMFPRSAPAPAHHPSLRK